ncbi:unnamed protein product [Heterobilharzia americana]|nr:unnamed protein product [Heterobilharzia americana]
MVPKVIHEPTVYITRQIQVTELSGKTSYDATDGGYFEGEQVDEEKVEEIEEPSPPATPLDDPWVAFKKPAQYERRMKPPSTSEPLCVYIDQLRFMPDNSTIFKVTGRLLNTNYDEELLDILIVPEETSSSKNNSRSPVFPSDRRFIVNLRRDKTLANNSLLFLRVYTLTLNTLEYCVVGNALLKIFNADGLLNIGGHQLRLRCELPKPISQKNNEYIYLETALDNSPYIHCSTILVRLLPYTKKPIPAPEYRRRSYHSDGSIPTEFEWVVYRQFQADENRKKDIRSVVKMILRREGEFDSSKDLNLGKQGFLRNGTHELCIIKPPIRSSTLNKIQERNEEVTLTWRTDDIIEKASLTIQLRDARFLDFVEEKKLEQQPNYDQPQSDQLDKTNESIDLNEQMKKLDDINLHAMVKYRAENDVNWLEKDKDGVDQLLTEIHELLKTEVVSEKCKILSL